MEHGCTGRQSAGSDRRAVMSFWSIEPKNKRENSIARAANHSHRRRAASACCPGSEEECNSGNPCWHVESQRDGRTRGRQGQCGHSATAVQSVEDQQVAGAAHVGSHAAPEKISIGRARGGGRGAACQNGLRPPTASLRAARLRGSMLRIMYQMQGAKLAARR